ncbi:MAG: hydrogenase 3 maturation endopeptidase HyCI [Candidatus Bipolaricaulota bacterium]|nr:MAG: hydrogenase 3 maturation endopeptidase HyCI [Candidatus Bipolaricaulota bacterium]
MKRMLLGVGNRLRGDDGVGPEVVERLAGSDWLTVDAGSAPENVTGRVAREAPDLLVIVDAAEMGLSPGTLRRLPDDDAPRMLASTHGLPLSFLLERLRSAAGEIVLIGVQPSSVALGEGLSPRVGRAADELVGALRAVDLGRIPALRSAEPREERRRGRPRRGAAGAA